MKYGQVAISAVKKVVQQSEPPFEAWNEAAVEMFGIGSSNIDKGCPRNAFLGLCEEGLLKGVKAGKYTRSDLNKKYAVKAVEILKTSGTTYTSIQLWKDVLNHLNLTINKAHNAQMDVVLGLWNAGHI